MILTSLVFIGHTTIFGSKAGVLLFFSSVLAIILISSHASLNYRQFALRFSSVVLILVAFVVLGIVSFLFGSVYRSYWASGLHTAVDIFSNKMEFFGFLFSRLAGLDDFILIVSQPDVSHSSVYNFKIALQSWINLISVGNPFETLPLTQYIVPLFRHQAFEATQFVYSSHEVTMPGSIYLLSGVSWFIWPAICVAGFLCFLTHITFHVRILNFLYPLIIFQWSLLPRSLSIDDTAFMLVQTIIVGTIINFSARMLRTLLGVSRQIFFIQAKG